MRKVILNMTENYKYETIKACHYKRLSKQGAATRLGVTVRQVKRLLIKYNEHGKSIFIHGNKGMVSTKKISEDTKSRIVELYKGKYFLRNYRRFTELLEKHESIMISETFVRQLLHDNDIYPPRIWKRTLNRANAIKKVKTTNDDEISITKLEVPVEKLHPSKGRKKHFGEEVQVDASNHRWFGERKAQLHAAIDNCTGSILALHFDWQETLKGYYKVYSTILSEYGIPYEFSTDRRTIFEYKKKASCIENDTFTQFAYVCKHFGANIKTSRFLKQKDKSRDYLALSNLA